MIKHKSCYAPKDAEDGIRILVDAIKQNYRKLHVEPGKVKRTLSARATPVK